MKKIGRTDIKIEQRKFLEFVSSVIGTYRARGMVYTPNGYYAETVKRVLINGFYTSDDQSSLNDLRGDFMELYKKEQHE